MTTEPVTWPTIAARLAPERSYWLSTAGRGGGPHVAPIWACVVDEVCYFYSERSTVKARNLAADPRVALNLADGEDVLIVYGTARDIGHPASHPDVVAAFSAKYIRAADAKYLPAADPDFNVLYALIPERALMWSLTDFEGSQRRWRATAR